MRKLFATAAMVLVTWGMAHASEPSKQEAMAMVKQAAAVVNAGKKEQLIAEVNSDNKTWHQGELYLIVLAADGSHLAHPTNSKLLGKSMLDVPDVDGKLFRQERVELAKTQGEGWVDYKYKNPANGKIEDKTLYVLRAGDVILSAGVYK
ncbi:MAG TPA: cache domain-containing protein [Limnobacter sp.]|nr:cache domain-containing protein [Limnobacter sp.]